MQSVYQNSELAFTRLPDAAIAAMNAACPRRQFDAGQIIMQRGEACTGFWVIGSGQVATGRFLPSGGFTQFTLLGEAQLLGDLAFHAGLRRQADAVAWSACELTWVDRRNWARLLGDVDGLALVMMQSLALHLAASLNRIAGFEKEPAILRLTREILTHADEEDCLALTQSQLADLIGVTRITIGTALRALTAQRLIATRYGHIRIINRQALSAWIDTAARSGSADR